MFLYISELVAVMKEGRSCAIIIHLKCGKGRWQK